MSLFEINGTKIHAVDLNPEGDDPVVMIHGLFSSLAVYYLSIALKVSRRRRVILYDMRGHGLSERRDEGYTPGMLSGDLCDLLDTLKLPRADIVAYSYGTTVALHTALHHPERVCRLILIEAMFLNKARDTQLVVGEEANGTTGEVAGKEGGGGGGGAISESANDAAFEKGLAEYTASTGIPIGPVQKERIRSLSRHFHEKDRLVATLNANHRLFDETTQGRLALPTLLLYGEQSPYLNTGRMLSSHIPMAQLHTIEGDHNIPVQQGEWITQQLEDFLGHEGP